MSSQNPSSTSNKYLYDDMDLLPDFQLKAEVVTCFIQCRDEILVLKRSGKEDQSFSWCVPGGKLESQDASPKAALIRELLEETGILFPEEKLACHSSRYGRVPGWDYKVYFYQMELVSKPAIKLSLEHEEYRWVTASRFKQLPLLKGQAEAFDIIFPSGL